MNKEIEEILNKLKNKAKHYILYDYEVNLLLSYIEQLEKRNKQLYEGFMATQEELTDYATENEQLENNRDKAIEYIEKDLQISILPNNQIINGTEVVKRINKIINILGDKSD